MKYFPVIVALFCANIAAAQVPEKIQRYRGDVRGNVLNRLKSTADGNRVRTVFFNNGAVSDWYTDVTSGPHLEWPKGTGHRHADGFSFFLGAKLKIINLSGVEQYITPIESGYREEMDRDPVSGVIWGYEPVAGYSHPSSGLIACSDIPASFPASWPAALGLPADYDGEWFSHFGKGARNDVQEHFYVMDDSRDMEFARNAGYYPINGDTSRGGLGTRVEVRTMQFRHPELLDIVFWNYAMTNISDRDYDTTIAGFFCDPSVGSNINSASLTRELNLAYMWSVSGTGLPDNYATGYFGISVLPSTDDSLSISSAAISYLNDKGPTGMWPKNDGPVWNRLSAGIIDTTIVNSNFMLWCATGPFSFPKWSTQTYSLAMIFGNDLSSLIKKQTIAGLIHKNIFIVPADMSESGSFPVVLTGISEQSVLSGTATIPCQSQGAAGNIRTALYVSSGLDDRFVGIDSTGTSSIPLNTQMLPDGILYKLTAITTADNGIGIGIVENVSINNAASALPQIVLDETLAGKQVGGVVPLKFLGGDADGDSCRVRLFVQSPGTSEWRPGTEWTAVPATAKSHMLQWDSRYTPGNYGTTTSLRLTIVSGVDTVLSNILPVSVVNAPATFSGDSLITRETGNGTGTIEVVATDPSVIVLHDYRLTFSQMPFDDLFGRLTDMNSGTVKFDELMIVPGIVESPTFDNIRLKITNDPSVVDTMESGWEDLSMKFPLSAKYDDSNVSQNAKLPNDYRIMFYDTPADTALIAGGLYKKIPVPFRIKNLTNDTFVKFLHYDTDNSNTLSRGDTIRIVDNFVSMSDFKRVIKVGYGVPENSTPEPGEGDVYTIRTKKPFTPADTIVFSTYKLTGVADEFTPVPGGFFLSQNYPNPFNPVTTIRFVLPGAETAALSVFDILGRTVATLINDRLPAGEHAVRFNAQSLPTGVYFYRLQAGRNTFTRKLLLLK